MKVKRVPAPVVDTNFPDLLSDGDDDGQDRSKHVKHGGPPREVTVSQDNDVDSLLDFLLSDEEEDGNNKEHRVEENTLDPAHVETALEKARSTLARARENQQIHFPVTSYEKSKHYSIESRPEVIHLDRNDADDDTDDDEGYPAPTYKESKKVSFHMNRANRKAMSDDTSQTASDDLSPVENLQVRRHREENDDEEEQSEEEFENEFEEDYLDDEEEEEEDVDHEEQDERSTGTADLLNRAHDRLSWQGLQEEIERLKELLNKKDQELEHLSGQLRRAVATKCDLVLAHTELERHHEFNLKQKEAESNDLLKANRNLAEEHAGVEREFMNEIVKVSTELAEVERMHREELEDWERMHKNEMLEKDYEIAQLKQEIRKLTDPTGPSSAYAEGVKSVPKRKGLTAVFRRQASN